MNIKIQQAENSVERVDNNVIKNLYSAHKNGNISQEVDSNNQKIGLVGTIQADSGYGNQVSTLNSAYPKFHVSVTNEYLEFEDTNTEAVCAKYFGDGVGCTLSQLQSAYSNWDKTVDGVDFVTALSNAGAKKFNEFQYVQGISRMNYQFFGNYRTLEELTLPNGNIVIGESAFNGHNVPEITINNAGAISYMEEQGSNKIKRGYILNFNKYTGRFENNGYGRSEIALCGNPYIIIPRNSLLNRTSSNNFEINELYNTYTLVFREDFVSNTLYIRGRGNNGYNIPFYTSVTSVVFLSTTPPFNSIDLSNNQSTVYVPSSATSAYSSLISNHTISTLDVFANTSDDNKAILVEAGCTATGSTGNWTITPPSA